MAMEAQRTNPVGSGEPSHDAYTRLLHRLEPTYVALWLEVKAEVCLTSGVLVLDDTVLDKPSARKMDLVHRMWSGKRHAVAKGIDLLTFLWTDGERHLPYDYLLYDKPNNGKTKNDHFGDLIYTVKESGFQIDAVG
jgi:putative transposase